MGALVEEAIRRASRALVEHDAELALDVIKADARINDAQREVSRLISVTIATQQPGRARPALPADARPRDVRARADRRSRGVASPSRSASSPRSRRSHDYVHLPEMAERAAVLVHGVLRALVDADAVAAREVAVAGRRHRPAVPRDLRRGRRADAPGPGERRTRDADHHRVALSRADRRSIDQHRRGHRLPRHRATWRTSTRDRRAPIRVLFVCTGNSARSVMAEALLRQPRRGPRSRSTAPARSPRASTRSPCASWPRRASTPSWARSKSVDEFLGQAFDYVVTVCDQARQSCPVFPGVHESLHWGLRGSGRGRGHRRAAHGRLPPRVRPARRADPPVRGRRRAARPV